MAISAGLGRVFNVIHQASGVNVPLTQGTAVSFVSFLDAGTQALAITQTDSKGVLSEIDLNGDFYAYKGPGVGGTWSVLTDTTTDNDVVNADATNDCVVITVKADLLTNGYDRVKCTAATGTCIAIIHDLLTQRKPSNLRSSLTA